MSLQVIDNATCTFCGCVCDDIQLHHDEVRIHKANKACVLGTAWFLNHTAEEKYPHALIDGREATLDEAIRDANSLARLSGPSRIDIRRGEDAMATALDMTEWRRSRSLAAGEVVHV